jgi:hypothetical protein
VYVRAHVCGESTCVCVCVSTFVSTRALVSLSVSSAVSTSVSAVLSAARLLECSRGLHVGDLVRNAFLVIRSPVFAPLIAQTFL